MQFVSICCENVKLMKIVKSDLDRDGHFYGTVQISRSHSNSCRVWQKIRLTIKYLSILRKFIESNNFNSNSWKSNVGFVFGDTLFVLDHLMYANSSTGNLFPLNYYCRVRKCLECKVEIIDKDGVICKLISSFGTDSTKINRSMFSYERDSSNEIPFLENTKCGSAYTIQAGTTRTNIFSNGVIDLIPHLEQFLFALNWIEPDLYSYRSSATEYVGLDDPDGDELIRQLNLELDFDSDNEEVVN